MPLVFPSGTSSHPKNTLQKGKLEFKILLLLHILIPGVMLSSSLETINPWLSACDLKEQDSKGSCAATTHFPSSTTPPPDAELLCPKECSPTESKTNASCLAYLNETRRNAICNFNLGNGIEWLKSFLGTIRLRYCCEYKIIESLSSSLLERVLRGKDECFSIIDSLVEVDNLAARLTCEFSEVLSRYDCRQPYSVRFSCNDCLEAYRRWVCSTLVPYYNDSVRIRPCRSVCQAVEQKCPYFLPENRAPSLPTQYAGEPTFLCMDPNIPEVGKQQRRSLYPDDTTCCVKICGSLKDGLCVEKGSKCKSEELISYEEALDQIVDCTAVDSIGTRVPNLECTASEAYSSPHKLGSGGPRALPRPTLILLSACLYHCFARGLHCPSLMRSFYDVLTPLSLLKVLMGLLPLSKHFPRTRFFFASIKSEAKMLFHFVMRPSSVSNSLQFRNYKWQYYFILISVNLLFKLFTEKSPPLMTPPFLFEIFTRNKKTRRARRYYFFYNYYRYERYYTILSRIAQKSRHLLKWKSFRAAKRGAFILVETEFYSKRHSVSKKKYSLTINRVKECSNIYKIIIIIRMERGISEASERSFGSSRETTRENEADDASAVVAPVAGLVGGKLAHARLECCRMRSAESIFGSLENFKLNHVRVSGVTSEPKCQFQTFS